LASVGIQKVDKGVESVIGGAIPKLRGEDFVTGRVRYTYDMELARMLHAKVKRSNIPHGRILKVDTGKASRLPGVVAIATGEDVKGHLYGSGLRDTPVLAWDRVRYIGEPVAAVAAESDEAAARAVELIEVEYEQLPAQFDPIAAMEQQPNVILHPDLLSYERATILTPRPEENLPNVCYHFKIRRGDTERAFRDADKVIENRFVTAMAHTLPLEPMASLADVEPDGGLKIFTSTQSPFRIRKDVCDALGLPQDRVRVIASPSSGAYGSRLNAHSEIICGLLALKSGRPTRLRFTREETFLATTVRHPFIIRVKDGVMKDGRIVAREISTILNGGAYSGGSGIWVTRNCAFAAVNCYNIENFRFDSYRVYTNLPPGGPFRGYGSTQIEYAIESQMDIIARMLKIPPAELRRRNLLRRGGVNSIGEVVEWSSLEECLLRAEKAILETRSPKDLQGPWRRGVGIAIAAKHSATPTGAAARVRVLSDGSVKLEVGASDTGQGTYTMLAQIAAKVLNAPLDKVKVLGVDTSRSPYDEGGFSSRQTFNSGNAVLRACENVKRQILAHAAERLGTEADALELKDGEVYLRADKSRKVSLEELHQQLRYGHVVGELGEFAATGSFVQPEGELDPETGQAKGRASAFYTPSATGVELAVNVETGQVKILRIVCVVDVGKVINRLGVEGQIEGGIAMALGAALYEEMLPVEGRFVNLDFLNYKVPTVAEMPEGMRIQCIILENPHPRGPFGAIGAGEVSTLGVAPAVANAIEDAVGVRIRELPITAEKILRAMKG